MKQVLLLVLFLSAQAVLKAQQFSFIHHSIEDGLAQSQVRAITQDSQGYLWFATVGGASRFDGKRFYNYSTEQGLLDNQVNCIYEDSGNDLWFGCTGGLTKFNGTEFFSYPFDQLDENYMVLDIVEGAQGELLVATNGNGLMRFSESSGRFERVNSFANDAFIRKLLKTQKGDLLIGSRNGVTRVVDFDFTLQKEVLKDISVSDIIVDLTGNIWLSSFGDGIFLLKETSTLQVTEEQGLQNNFVRELALDKSGYLWVASRSGLNKVSPEGIPVFNTNIGLNYDNIKTLFIDREENLWIGTDGKGVYRFTGERFVTFSKKDGLTSDIVMAIQKTDDGLWLGSYDNGACLFMGDTNKYFTQNEGLLHNTIWCLRADEQNRVWFGTNIGVSRYNEDGTFTNYTGPTDSTFFERVTAICEDSDNRMWFGVVDGIAVFENNKFVHPDELEDFPGHRVRCIFESRDGTMWFGAENGLVQKTSNGYKVFQVPNDLKNSVVYNVTQDPSGRIWVGTKGGLFTLENDKLNPVVFSGGFGSNTINFTQPANERLLYIGTNNGLFVLDIEAYNRDGIIRTEHFTDQEGLASLECNQNAVYLDSEGKLWFGTTEGVIRYESTEDVFDATPYQPIVQIHNIKLVLEEKNWDEYSDSIDVRTGLPIGLELQPKNNHLTFEFVGLYFSNPDKVVYQYMLEGIDKGWLPETPTNVATYASLSHGDYTFKVRARVEGTEWVDSLASFRFTILPPFYLTWWFITLAIITGLLVVAGLVLALLKNEERKRKTQHLIYTSRMLALEQQTLNSSMNRHFIFNALNSIQYYINRQDKLSANKYLSSFARLIRKNLDSSQSNFTSLADELERIDLYLSLENMRFPDKFTYQVNVSPEVDAHAVQIPAMLFQPYLENSIWHGILPMDSHGIISVTVSRQDEDIVIKIQDNGIGIDASRKIRNESENQHIPQGMEINRNRIELFRKMTDQNFKIEGPIDLKGSERGIQGTVVAITFPLKSSLLNNLEP